MSTLLRKSDVLRHFGNNNAKVGRAFAPVVPPNGISRVAVHNWPELVPELRARQLLDLYPELRAFTLDPVTLLTAEEMRAKLAAQDGQP